MGALDDKVVLVTGGGSGLGRAYAHLFAAEGAKVVVNDLGGDVHGGEGDDSAAQRVVDEIREAGGDAIANSASVTDPEGVESMIVDAVEHFGHLDVVVNNAGILRDKTLAKMTDAMWDQVIDVHLKGTFLVTRAAVRQMREQGEGGRIINTSSIAGLKGNFGQTNYGAAKAGVAGLTRVVALETRRDKITVNCIAPAAKTRMTEDLDAVPAEYTPESVAPLVVWLASEDAADVTGRIFGAHGGHYFEYLQRLSDGVERTDWTVEQVGQELENIARYETTSAAPSPGAGSTTARVQTLLKALPRVYDAAAAGDWRALIVFDVQGTGLFTLNVHEGGATVNAGAVEAPNATVTFDTAATLLSVADGTLKAEQAFMAGKLKSDDLSVLLSFAKFFDLEAAAHLGQVSEEPAPVLDPTVAAVDESFARLPEAFLPDKAGDWTATLHFKIGPELSYTVDVAAGTVETAEGLTGEASCTIAFESPATYLGVVAGKIKAEQAFMSGKITADNMSDLMRYAQCFDARKAKRGAGDQGLNKALVGRRFDGDAREVSATVAAAFAAATDDESPVYTEGADGQLAPPLFPVRAFMEVVTEAVTAPDLNADILRLVHGEQDMTFYRPLRPGEIATPSAEILSIDDKSSGQLLKVKQTLTVAGEDVAEAISGYFIRTGTAGSRKTDDRAEPEPRGEVVFSQVQEVADDQSIRYAEVSGDRNPIHTDPATAKAAGLPGVILHGLCTMAFASKAVVNGPCEGDSKRLRRLSVRFSKPVLAGWTLTTDLWRVASDEGVVTYGLEMVNQDGTVVLSHGLAEVIEGE